MSDAPRFDPAAGGPHRQLCVVLHDVAPTRWDGCTRVLRQVRAVAREAGVTVPVTLLLVPRLEGLNRPPALYLRWLHGLARAGHELALHGLTHRDDGPPPRSLFERLKRHVYTAGEGEFAALSRQQADARLAAGRAWAQEHELEMQGFVAPAWLLNAAGWDAVTEAGFSYTCTLNRVIALPGRQSFHAPSLVYSTRAAWRRVLSVWWTTLLARRQRHAPLLRLELHPSDCDHPAVQRCWTRLLRQALRERQPVRLCDAAQMARHDGTPPARRWA